MPKPIDSYIHKVILKSSICKSCAVRNFVSSGFLENILNNISDPIFVKDRQHRFYFLNEEFCKYVGIPHDELVGKKELDFFPHEQADVFIAKDEEVFNTGIENVSEEFITTKNGDKRCIVTKKSVFTDERGEQYLVGVIIDVTDIKITQEDLKEKNKSLEELNQTMVNRELRMIEMKNEITALKREQANKIK
jgi:PAS domain S-box-containing protein